jgi:type I restriction-modification system DNA methylase subunit
MSKKVQSFKNEHEKLFYSELDQATINGKHYKDTLFEWVDWALSLFKKSTDDIPPTEDNQRYFRMLNAFGQLCENYTDALGDVFMNRISHGQNDQYFTPKHICELMALMTSSTEQNETIMDSACGSGRTLLAGLKIVRDKGVEPLINGCDIDLLCCKMALLNMIVQTAQGEIWHGNMLTNEIWKIFRIERYLLHGNWISIWHEATETSFS